MDKKLLKKDYYIDVVDEYLGELIEEIVMRYYGDKIDIDEEYIDVLEYIADKFMDGSKSSSSSFEEKISRLSNNPSLAKVIISYLISRYIEERDGSLGE